MSPFTCFKRLSDMIDFIMKENASRLFVSSSAYKDNNKSQDEMEGWVSHSKELVIVQRPSH